MNKSTLRQLQYGALTLVGLVWTQYHLMAFLQWNAGEVSLQALLHFNWVAFFSSGFANPGAAFLTVDALIGATAFLLLLFPEAKRLGMRHAWVYFVLTFIVAFAVAFPLFLLMRERRLQQLAVPSVGD